MGAILFETVASYFGATAILAIVLFAFVVGERAERVGAGTYLVAWLTSLVLQPSGDMSGVQWGIFAIDIVVLAIFAAMVWKAARSWPVWACALQLLVVVSHIMVMLDLKTPVSAFYTVVNLTGYGILVAIAFGTFMAWQERKALGLDEIDDQPGLFR